MKSRLRHWRAIGIASAIVALLLAIGFWALAHHWLVPNWMQITWYITLVVAAFVWGLMILGKDA